MELTSNQLAFYENKIHLLESENHLFHEEVNSLRLKLRAASDFEIKYQVLMASSQKETEKLQLALQKAREEVNQQGVQEGVAAARAEWEREQEQAVARVREEAARQVEKLKTQAGIMQQELKQLREKSEEMELFGFKLKNYEKENEGLREQLGERQRELEEQKQGELAEQRAHLSSTFREKMGRERQQHEERVAELEGRINTLEMEKDTQTYRPPTQRHEEIVALRELVEGKTLEHEGEIAQLQASLEGKNREIARLLEEAFASEEKHRLELSESREQTGQLEDRLLQLQKKHEIELFHAIERLKAIKAEEVEALYRQIEQLQEELAERDEQHKRTGSDHYAEMEEMRRGWDDERRKIREEAALNQRKASEMNSRMREMEGEREIGETQMLINSLKDLDGRDDHLSSYENGITFLERQVKKCQIKLEEKSRAIAKLHRDLNEVRAEADSEVGQAKEQQRADRKQHQEQVLQLERQIQELTDRLRSRERTDKKRERDAIFEKNELQHQNSELKELVEELQRDYNRVIESKKGVESSYRDKRDESTTHKVDANSIKKQKWVQLERQKNDLDLVYKEKEEALRLQHEKQVQDLTTQHARLQQKHQEAQLHNEKLNGQVDQLQKELGRSRAEDQQAEYHKKMASLNLELALTQNLYEELLRVKQRAGQEQSMVHSFGSLGGGEDELDAAGGSASKFGGGGAESGGGMLGVARTPTLGLSFNPGFGEI